MATVRKRHQKTTTRKAKQDFRYHRRLWGDCNSCPLHCGRRNVVLFRGQLPSDVVFIGEAPGKSEDALAVPFIGEAGKLFDDILRESINRGWYHKTNRELRWSMTNIVACIPTDPESESGLRQPNRQEINQCSPRLIQFMQIARPSLIIALGAIAYKNIPPKIIDTKTPIIPLKHPSAILRSKSSVDRKRAVLNLSQALTAHCL